MRTSEKHFHDEITREMPALPEGVRTHLGTLEGRGRRVGLVVARFNIRLTSGLLTSAVEALIAAGVRPEDIEVVWVPGSFEIPLTLKRLAARGAFDALIACGVVIDGETRHAQLITGSLVQSFARLSLDLDCPVIDAVVSARSMEQAEARCLSGSESRGAYAARAALEVSSTF
ncbi:MAG: 6,7-dimethyl-8-ribityllumazine synthase [Kiritimatiellae bacterium]|nr:6,7-dimethyl-8-ribityllumazine synthase [Kiritimatiellia bacterium]